MRKIQVFKWLLAEADRADLQTLQGWKYYKDLSTEFRVAIEQALLTANPEGTRPSTLEKAKRAKEVVCEITNTSSEKEGFGDTIASYIYS